MQHIKKTRNETDASPHSGPSRRQERAAGSWPRAGDAAPRRRGPGRQKGRVPPQTGGLIRSTWGAKAVAGGRDFVTVYCEEWDGEVRHQGLDAMQALPGRWRSWLCYELKLEYAGCGTRAAFPPAFSSRRRPRRAGHTLELTPTLRSGCGWLGASAVIGTVDEGPSLENVHRRTFSLPKSKRRRLPSPGTTQGINGRAHIRAKPPEERVVSQYSPLHLPKI